MKNLLNLLAAMMAIISCGNNVETPQIPEVKLSIHPQIIESIAQGGLHMVSIMSSSDVSLSPWDEWYELDKGDRDESSCKTRLIVKVEENTSAQERTSKVSVVCGDEKVYLEIKQEGDSEAGKPSRPEPNDGYAWTVSGKLGIGWNLGNHFDAHNNGVSGETFWGNPKATEATFRKVKAAGFSTVRIPVTWLGHIGPAPDYKIDEAWLERIAEVVGYAQKVDLNVIINMHHDGADSNYWLNIKAAALNPSLHEQIMGQITAMWTQIANKFIDKGDFLIFEAFNEIHDGGWGWGSNRNDGGKQYKCLNEWNQAFVDAVRATGGGNEKRYLGIPAYCTNPDIAIEAWEMPVDKVRGRLMVSVHCYDPYDYTLPASKSEWGHTASEANKVPGDNEADLEKVFKKLYDHFFIRDTPVYLGEFGCVNRATAKEQAFQQYYLRYFAKLSAMYGIPCAIWDNGAKGHGDEKHAFIDHGTGEFCSPEAKAAIENLVRSYRSTQTLEQIYETAPKR